MIAKEKILRAYRRVLANDAHLLTAAANERSITHRLAVYLEQEFPDYNVDCEYNRKGLETKKLESFRREILSDNPEGVSVFPDIIIHHRGTANNFIVLEAKTTANPPQCAGTNLCKCDHCKRQAYKNDLKYRRAFFVIFPVGEEFSNFSDAKLADYIKEVP